MLSSSISQPSIFLLLVTLLLFVVSINCKNKPCFSNFYPIIEGSSYRRHARELSISNTSELILAVTYQ